MQICHICAHEPFYVCIKTDYLGTSREVETKMFVQIDTLR